MGRSDPGTVDRREHDGRQMWRLRMTLGGERRVVGYYESEEAARGVARAMARELAGTELDLDARGDSLGAFGIRWLKGRERTHRDAGGDAQRWRAYVAGRPIAQRRLTALTSGDVTRWLQEILDEPSERTGELRSKQTVANALTTLRACLAAARRAELLTANPAEGIDLPRGTIEQETEVEEDWTYLREHEVEAVLAIPVRRSSAAIELIDEGARTAFVVGVYAGLRAGELAGLRWSDVRDDRRELFVARSRRGATKAGVIGRVPLLEPALEALDRWRGLTRPDLRTRPDALVWPAKDGGPRPRGYDWGWSDTAGSTVVRLGRRRLAGITRRVTWHSATRHTCASHLLLGTWAPRLIATPLRLEEVSRWLRHSSRAVTERYVHLGADALHSLVVHGDEEEVGAAERSGDWSERSRARRERRISQRSQSHLEESNLRPTVYETVALARDSAHLGPLGTSGQLALEVLHAVERGDPRAVAMAVALCERLVREEAGAQQAPTRLLSP